MKEKQHPWVLFDRYNQILAPMQDFAILENPSRRELDNQDDIERLVDYDQQEQEKELKNKIVFSIQALGGIRTIKRQDQILQAYIKGPHCEESVRDLVKFIRQDSPFNPKSRLILADFNIVESDLLKLLPLQVEDKKLSFWIIALLALMTSKPNEELNPEETSKLYDSLRAYKQSFIDRECFQILIVHLAEYYRTPEEKRTRAHNQMQEFLILLLRNLAQIPNHQKQPNLHNHFLAALLKEEIMSPILYILQKDFTSFRDKVDIPLLQIIYHTFTCFDPQLVYASKNNSLVSAARICKNRQIPLQTRHSRFLPHFKMTSETGIQRLSYKLQEEEKKPIQGQRQLPQRMGDYKKVVRLELQKFGSDFMTMHTEIEGVSKSLGSIASTLTEEFLELEFQLIIKMVFDDVFRESPKVNDNNIMQYLLLCSWALQMIRARYHHQREQAANDLEKGQIKLELSWVVEVMQNAHFELIYKLLLREATREKKKFFKINLFNAALKLFDSYLDVIGDLSSSMNMSDRKNANILMSNIFRHDIARIIRIGFGLVTHEGIISTLIKVTYKFFKLLSIYSEGKILTIQTNRLLKRKKKHYQQNEDELEQYKQHDAEPEEAENNPMKEDEGRFQERKYNEKSQFAIVAEYPIISKYLIFLHDERFLSNEEDLNTAIFFYFTQIKRLLNGEWLFFQADTISTFQSILSNHEWSRNHRDIAKFVQGVCLAFIKLLRKNPLALVESLFKYSNLTLKDHILKNYSQEYEDAGQQQENMFTDE